MMGDIALRRVLSHVNKVLTCSRASMLPAAATCHPPPRHNVIMSQAAPASTAAAPSPDAMATSSESSSGSSTSATAPAVHDLTRAARHEERSRDGLGRSSYNLQAETLTPISSSASILSAPGGTQASCPVFGHSDFASQTKAAASVSSLAGTDTEPLAHSPVSSRQSPAQAAAASACPFAASQAATPPHPSMTPAAAPDAPPSVSSEAGSKPLSDVRQEPVRPFNDLPCPPGWPILGSFVDYFKRENRGQMHELMRRRHREFGKIFREQFGPRQNVVIADPDLMAEVLRKEGKYPSRPPYESWVLYNKLRRKDGGLMTSEREYWKRSRGVLATKLRPRAVADYVPIMNEVCSDFLSRIAALKVPAAGHSHNGPPATEGRTGHSQSGSSGEGHTGHLEAPHTVPRMLNELNKFTMETILYVMLNKRVGCLDESPSEQVDSFIRSIATMFLTGHQLMVYANIHKLLSTRPWREHVQSWDKIYEFASRHVNQCIDEVSRDLESTSPSEGEEPVSFLKYVVGTQQLTRSQIVDNVIEVFMGGIDTTANALAFLFYLLSKNESVQGRLVAEVDGVVGGRQPTSADLQHMPYLKACVKETLRLFPPIPINARTTTQESTLGGYHIPKDTILMLNLYVMSRDEKVFSNPDEFHPERWLREGRDENEPLPHPFSLLPFGSGVRSCVGRRVAETQMYLATIQVLQRYSLQKSGVFDIKPFVRTQLTPGPELPVMFIER